MIILDILSKWKMTDSYASPNGTIDVHYMREHAFTLL